MDIIKVGIFCEHRLILQGLCQLMENIEDIQVSLKENSMEKLLKYFGLRQINILIFYLPELDAPVLKLSEQLDRLYPKIRVLILSESENESTILKTIKTGAKGFLSKDCDRNDLIEAIYTLRSGHDYFSKSITQLLLKKYISDLQTDETLEQNKTVNTLSSRELEILKLWGSSQTNNEISEKLYISVRTVESHKNHIMQKLNLKTAVDLVKFGIRNNIIKI
ncbi:response regulator transcription factor [Oceanispirochaeta sp.]|jgi:DNA-binding NarL/FixJ family response regulator|uniref:LuxR C-terminal-related transcriptional regulator n=1 Tax=Oceanispirochaeta sp. TaxID=2035350 RepID=UPI0026341DAC|nr:response regulator transcription factor [Oceanispirochaeta sp.]MDA3956726.1 response regulator transcription factor [Oceanispirochaeta sp.]